MMASAWLDSALVERHPDRVPTPWTSAAEADAALSCPRRASSIKTGIPSGRHVKIRNLTRVG